MKEHTCEKKNSYIKAILINYLVNNKSTTGYEFIKHCKSIGVPASNGNVYPLLKKLTEEKILTYEESGNKKIYRFTKKGKKSLENTFMDVAPAYLRNAVINNILVGVKVNWNNPDDIDKLIKDSEELLTEFKKFSDSLRNKHVE